MHDRTGYDVGIFTANMVTRLYLLDSKGCAAGLKIQVRQQETNSRIF